MRARLVWVLLGVCVVLGLVRAAPLGLANATSKAAANWMGVATCSWCLFCSWCKVEV